MLRRDLKKCRDCKHFTKTKEGVMNGVYGKCELKINKPRPTPTDVLERRQGGCYACVKYEPKE